MAGEGFEIILRNRRVATDDNGNVCLNDLWRLAGEPESKRPNDWHRGQRAKTLRAALCERIAEDLGKLAKDVEKSVYYTSGRGRGARTFAHRVLALDYAEYLDPQLGVDIREIFLRYKVNDVALALEILDGLTEQAEYDELRLKLRQRLKEHNRILSGAAKGAGVTDFKAFNGSGLRGLYGMTKDELLRHKNLPPEADHLNHAGHEELAANYFKATQTEAKLRREKIRGQANANDAHHTVGEAIRGTIEELGGTMPEDEPALDHIKEAEKRLKANKTLLEKR
jgi:hypothetical protein